MAAGTMNGTDTTSMVTWSVRSLPSWVVRFAFVASCCTYVGWGVMTTAHAQVETYGYGVMIDTSLVGNLQIGVKTTCRLLVPTRRGEAGGASESVSAMRDSVMIRDESCNIYLGPDGDAPIASGTRFKYEDLESVELVPWGNETEGSLARSAPPSPISLRDSNRTSSPLLGRLLRGKANIYVDKGDPSMLVVNFREFEYECVNVRDGQPRWVTRRSRPGLLKRAWRTLFYPEREPGSDDDGRTRSEETASSPQLLGIPSDACQRTYDAIRESRFALSLKNRDRLRFETEYWFITGVTIPLKYSPGYTESLTLESGADTTVAVLGRAAASVNGNIMGGYRLGVTDYKFVRGGSRSPEPKVHVGPGMFAGLSVASIGKNTTKADPGGLEESVSIVVASFGFGTLVTVRTFTLGLFVGRDHGFGETAEKWDFQDRWWFGVGITTDQLAKVLGI